MSQKCVFCKTVLPTDMPSQNRSVDCSYCKQPNPNPTYLPEPNKRSFRGMQIIKLQESSLSYLWKYTFVLIGITIFVLQIFLSTPRYFLILSSIFTHLPIFPIHFVPQYWEKIAKRFSSESGEGYKIQYKREENEWVHYLESYIFQFWYLYLLFYNLLRPLETDVRFVLTVILTAFFAFAGAWILHTIIATTAKIFGKIFAKW